MKKTAYDQIGKDYNNTRVADPRITKEIFNLLELPRGAMIADIGAGTGNYSCALSNLGFKLICIEPSEEMIKQAIPSNNIKWLQGYAENIPLPDNSVDGIVMILSLHHFSNVEFAVREAARICPRGQLVVFTMDPRKSEEFWFNEYFPEIAVHVEKSFLPLEELISLFTISSKWTATIRDFPLPSDLMDKNMCSGWNKPEMYFDSQFRQNTSGFALADQNEVEKALTRLYGDLSTGEWYKKYGSLRKRDSFDAGFRFIRFGKNEICRAGETQHP
jgi:ubiquinone/menaquinone biosynthesis C-methylase UbiE